MHLDIGENNPSVVRLARSATKGVQRLRGRKMKAQGNFDAAAQSCVCHLEWLKKSFKVSQVTVHQSPQCHRSALLPPRGLCTILVHEGTLSHSTLIDGDRA